MTQPSLVIATPSGALADSQKTTQTLPFAKKTGIQTSIVAWDGTLQTLQSRAENGRTGWTMALMDNTSLDQACLQGLVIRAFPSTGGVDSCSWPALQMNIVLAWDRGKLTGSPVWSDFWDVARHPGKRGLRRDPRTTLEIALMADGVAPGDVYQTLSTPAGVARAFRKLNQLRPYIVWWTTPGEAERIIQSGSALMTSAPNSEVVAANTSGQRNFGVQWAEGIQVGFSWGIIANVPDKQIEQARQFLAFTDQPAIRDDFLAHYSVQPPALNDDADDASSNAQSSMPDVPSLRLNEKFWDDHFADLNKQFQAWVATP